jgi:hypothetical protein
MAASRRSELIRLGWTDRELKRAVAEGRLLKPRANAYLLPGTDPDLIDACALGGRLTCVSELARHGVFVLERETLHLHFHEARDLAPKTSRRMRRHWGRPRRAPHPSALALELFDALRESVRCQTPRAAIATLDSVLHLGLLQADDLDELFATLPRRYGVIRSLVDERCESGPESLLRLILRTLGVSFEVQVIIPRVGRVDFVVDDGSSSSATASSTTRVGRRSAVIGVGTRPRPRSATRHIGPSPRTSCGGRQMYRRPSWVCFEDEPGKPPGGDSRFPSKGRANSAPRTCDGRRDGVSSRPFDRSAP